ncbi:hypothetical protein I4N56_017895 [Pseudomonas mohnii]|uniref:hypothetical protein n=1 Tax=Pseudomonas mohnii TaxID=395600 RepID=UPI0018C6F764|nr:hypothetical protein [Pseudomonas mohnii]
MKLYQISYDLRKQRDYPSLYERIKAYGTWCHALESSWIIVTDQTSVQVRDNLQTALDWDDGLLVTRLQGEGAWVGLSDEITQWLKNQAPHCTV